ncbi:hypothetical protein C4544_05150 [candidate division WS5 bacterium]|uniref:Uncharacterized protein n=1 Tax=candidate division WS5 bacterium TaxID=2093353 RepID=A0A419DBB8_9BACT|nr:MAG: hypothetical protein C4544_05150 [candidate division WS5 bacterium]
MLHTQDKKRLKSLIQDDRYDLILKVARALIEKYKTESKKRENEFETIWALAANDGAIDGIKSLLNNLEQEAL